MISSSVLGKTTFPAFSVPINVTNEKLKLLLKAFQKTIPKDRENDEEEDADLPYLFFINGHEIQSSIDECIKHQILSKEKTIPIVYQPQAIFKVSSNYLLKESFIK